MRFIAVTAAAALVASATATYIPEPEYPSAPEAPEYPSAPEPEYPSAPEPEYPEVPEVPEYPEVPEVPEYPEAPEVPEYPEAPEVPEYPEVPVPEYPEVPTDVSPEYPSSVEPEYPSTEVPVYPTPTDVSPVYPSSSGEPDYTTTIVTDYVTVCPGPTSFVYGTSTYIVTEPTTITIPSATMVYPIYTSTICASCPTPSAVNPVYPTANGTAPAVYPTGGYPAPPPMHTGAASRAMAGAGAALAGVLGLAALL